MRIILFLLVAMSAMAMDTNQPETTLEKKTIVSNFADQKARTQAKRKNRMRELIKQQGNTERMDTFFMLVWDVR